MSASALSFDTHKKECPECHAEITRMGSFPLWCEECHWNLSEPDESIKDIYEIIYEKLNSKKRDHFFDSFLNDNSEKSVTYYKVILYLFSFFVFSIPVVFFIAAVYLFFESSNPLLKYLVSGLSLSIAFITLPRSKKIDDKLLTKKEAPKTFEVFDRLSKHLGCEPVDYLCLDKDFNAFYSEIGMRSKKIVGIGSPLLYTFNDEELIFILCHELAHGKHSDSSRSVLVERAFTTLVNLHNLIMPDRLIPEESGLYGIIAIPFTITMAGLAQIIVALLYFGLSIYYNMSQLSEYKADSLAYKFTGSEVAESAFNKLILMGEYFYFYAYKYADKNLDKSQFYESFQKSIPLIPPKERLRIQKLSEMNLYSFDLSHPPTYYRIKVAKHIQSPQSDDFDSIKGLIKELREELKQLSRFNQKKIIDDYLEMLQ